MALVKDPFNSGQASGKVGSQVAARNASGTYIRRNAKPVNPKSPVQTQRRYSFTKVGDLFLNLSTARIDAWNTFGATWSVPNRLGDSVFNSGISWFKAFNSRLLARSVSIILDPPLNPQSSYLPNVSISQTGGGAILFGITDVSLAARQALWLKVSGNLTRSRRFLSNGVRLVTIFTSVTKPVDQILVPAAELSLGDSSRQVLAQAVDEYGRSTAPVRFTIFPTA